MKKLLLGLTTLTLMCGGMATSASANEDAFTDFNRGYVCYARTRRGQTFEARGRDQFRTQQRAVEKCRQARHRSCHAAGCRQVR